MKYYAEILFRRDEHNHVEKPFLGQHHGLGWMIICNERKSAAL